MDLAAKNGWGAGGGAGSPELCSRGGAAPEKTESGLPVVVSGRGWVLEHARGTSNPLGYSAGRCGVRGDARGGGGGLAQQSPRRAVHRPPRRATVYGTA